MMMTRFAAVRLFVTVAQSGNFSSAARRLGVTPSAIARQISGLEQQLGVRLLNRTTRRMQLTEAGRIYFERAERIVREFDDLNRDVAEIEARPRGLLRVTAPFGLGSSRIAKLLPEFLAAYSDVRVELSLDDRVVDLVDAKIDLAFRISTGLPDSSLIARRLFRYRRIICASPAYLAQRGRPERPEELSEHECLTFLTESPESEWRAGGRFWHLRGPRGEVAVPVHGRLVANSRAALIEAAENSFGLLLVPSWQVEAQLESGALEIVLSNFEVDPHAEASYVYVMYAAHRYLSPKMRVFIDFVTDRLAPEATGATGAPALC